jgi:hypothetical protein
MNDKSRQSETEEGPGKQLVDIPVRACPVPLSPYTLTLDRGPASRPEPQLGQPWLEGILRDGDGRTQYSRFRIIGVCAEFQRPNVTHFGSRQFPRSRPREML